MRADHGTKGTSASEASARLQIQKRGNRWLIPSSLSAFEVLLGPDGQG
jgi:hypothetical protein